jgi:hypothetical protein
MVPPWGGMGYAGVATPRFSSAENPSARSPRISRTAMTRASRLEMLSSKPSNHVCPLVIDSNDAVYRKAWWLRAGKPVSIQTRCCTVALVDTGALSNLALNLGLR